MLELYAYNAGKGDCIRLRFGDDGSGYHNVFIDTGVTRFGENLKRLFHSIIASGETLDALILTHVDNDHIGGMLYFLRRSNKCRFKEVWMNHIGAGFLVTTALSTRENDEIYTILKKQGVTVRSMVEGDVRQIEDAIFRVLNPKDDEKSASEIKRDTMLARYNDYRFSLTELADKPINKHDASLNNKKSIVFTFEYRGTRLLFTGDAWADDVVKAIGNFDIVKLPHHGSVGNISEVYPKSFLSHNFLICADGNGHPDKQTVAKIEKWYGEVNIFSPVAWWKNRYFVGNDRSHKIHYYKKEGFVISW